MRELLHKAIRLLVRELQQELALQKHEATGKLIQSHEGRVIPNATGYTIEIWAEDYARYVNRGRKPRAKRVPIQALIEWIKVKGFESGDQNIKSLAFAIQQKIYKEGIPTRGSKRIAPRRTNYVDFVLDEKFEGIEDIIADAAESNVVDRIDQLI